MSETPQAPTTPAWNEKITLGRFDGKTVIVTGAASGIGRATALRIAKEGGTVVASDISLDGLHKLVADHPDLTLKIMAGDVSDEEVVAKIVAACDGTIHGLANIAGVMDKFAPIHEVDDSTWDRVLRVNVTGIMRLSRGVVPVMLETGAGSIVNITSEAGLRGSAAGVAYTASKHAVVGITRNTAFIYGPQGLRCNAIAPGAVATGIEANFASELGAARIGGLFPHVVPPPASAEQLAASITFLLSDDATNINGAILPSDGGWSAL